MLCNTFSIAFRSLAKNKVFTVLNISGLAIGLAAFLLIVLYVVDELRYDRYNINHDRIFRVNMDVNYGGAVSAFAVAAPPMAGAMIQHFPEVENAVRMSPAINVRIRKGEDVIKEDRVMYADPSLFDVFTLPVIQGKPETALASPEAIVLTESAARKYFATADAVGRTLSFIDDSAQHVVTAVIEDIPEQSHFHADIFLSTIALPSSRNTSFNQFTFNTYVLLRSGANQKDLEVKLQAFLRKHLGDNMDMDAFEKGGNYIRAGFTPLTDIHLRSARQRELEANGDIHYVYMFSAVALLTLLLACINFMNLSTARSADRAREVGIRKVLGSLRRELIARFLAESMLTTLLATIAAITMAWLLLPLFNQLAGKTLTVTFHSLAWLFPVIAGIVTVVGVVAGFYPAFFLSRFQPVHVLKGKLTSGLRNSTLRGVLVIFQFSISTFLVIGTLVVYDQMAYIRNKDVGFNREQVLIIRNAANMENPQILKEEVRKLPGVVNASLSGYLPTGGTRWMQGISGGEQRGLLSEFWRVDPDYLPTLEIPLLAGRNFSESIASDSLAIIVNEAAAKVLGYHKDPLGELVHVGQGTDAKDYVIIGMVTDFNFSSLHDQVAPLVMVLGADWSSALNVRADAASMPRVLEQAQGLWKTLAPGHAFDHSFMDKDFEALYNQEQRMEKLFMIFAVLAVVIACLGLFGLSSYTAEQRTKEMSIRKVLGATAAALVVMLSLDFVRLVLIAIGLAVPLAAFAMEEWLQTFAYRVNPPVWAFLTAMAGTVAIALATVVFQSLKAAHTDPVRNLRSE